MSEMNMTQTENGVTPKARHKKALILGAILGAIIIAFAGTTTAFATYYQGKAVPGTKIAGIAVGGKTEKEITKLVEEKTKDLHLKVSGDVTESPSITTLGYQVDAALTAKKTLQTSNSWTDRVKNLLVRPNIDPVFKENEHTLKEYTDGLLQETGKAPQNAMLVLDKETIRYKIIPGKAGYGIDAAALKNGAIKAISTLKNTEVKVTAKKREPRVTTKDAENFLVEARKILNTPFEVKFNGESYSPRIDTKVTWVTLASNKFGKQNPPTANKKAVDAWVNKLAGQLKQEPEPGLQNVDADGNVLTKVSQPVDGYEINNAKEISQAGGNSFTSSKPYVGEFTSTPLKAGWKKRTIAKGAENLSYPAAEGEKWIDVNLSNHTIAAYVGAQLVRGPERMVHGAPSTPTRPGIFRIQRKLVSDTMRGDDYVVPNVPYALYYDGGYAIHGAYWRTDFTHTPQSGSHGCVNLPVGTASWFFEWAGVGTTVAIH